MEAGGLYHETVGLDDMCVGVYAACAKIEQSSQDAQTVAALIELCQTIIDYIGTPSPEDEPHLYRMLNLIDLLGPLPDIEKAEIEQLVPDLIRETPRTKEAATRLKTIYESLKPTAYTVFVKVLSDILSATAKKVLGL